MTRRKEQKQQTRQAILDAAIESFAELGFDAASVGMIAKRCGCKKALVQYHFASKEKLWQAAVTELWQQREAALPQYFPGTPGFHQTMDGAESLRFVLRQILRFAFAHPAWVGIMFREAASPGPRLEWFIETHLRNDYEQGLAFISSAQHQGLLPEGDPLEIILIISGALFYLILTAPLTEKITGRDARDETFIDSYLSTLLGMLGCEST